MEPVSFALTVLTTIGEVTELVKKVQSYRVAYGSNPDFIQSLLRVYGQLESTLRNIMNDDDFSRTFPHLCTGFVEGSLNNCKDDVEQSLTNLKEIVELLKKRGRGRCHAISIATKLGTLESSARQINGVLSSIVGHRGLARSFQDVAMGLSRQIENIGTHRTPSEQFTGPLCSVHGRASSDSWCAMGEWSFRSRGATASWNPPHVVLDFHTTDESNVPVTVEGKFLDAIVADRSGKIDENKGESLSPLPVAAVGMGGVGKSCALRGLRGLSEIQSMFPDGVFCITLGKDATRDTIGRKIWKLACQISNAPDSPPEKTKDFEVVLGDARAAFLGKSCLLLVDDVWESSDTGRSIVTDMSSILDWERKSRMAITTRNFSLCGNCKVILFTPRQPFSMESRNMLLAAAGYQGSEPESECEELIDKVLKFCGGLPVALAVAGSTVNGFRQHCGNVVSTAWEICLTSLQKRSYLVQESPMDGDYRSLAAAITVSLDALDDARKRSLPDRVVESEGSGATDLTFRQMYRAMCVLPKQVEVPIAVLDLLWGLENHHATIFAAQAMANHCLFELDMHSQEIRIHDLFVDFAVEDAHNEQEESIWHEILLFCLHDWCQSMEGGVDSRKANPLPPLMNATRERLYPMSLVYFLATESKNLKRHWELAGFPNSPVSPLGGSDRSCAERKLEYDNLNDSLTCIQKNYLLEKTNPQSQDHNPDAGASSDRLQDVHKSAPLFRLKKFHRQLEEKWSVHTILQELRRMEGESFQAPKPC